MTVAVEAPSPASPAGSPVLMHFGPGEPTGLAQQAGDPSEAARQDAGAFALHQHYAYEPTRKMRVITIGAGFSGLIMAHKFLHRIPDMREVQHTIFEANKDIGGTWLVNNYPGLKCDVPAHIYSFPFDPKPDWDRVYATGPEILSYMKETVRKWGLDKDLHLNTRVVGAKWLQDRAQWRVTVTHAGVERDEYCEVLISGQGVLTHESWPEIPGMRDGVFQGHVVHSARWDHGLDYSNKRIAVIGNGASGVQILPEMASLPGTTVTNFIRGPAWFYHRPPPFEHLGRDPDGLNPQYTEQEKARLKDPQEHLKYRKSIVSKANKSFYVVRKGDANETAIKAAAAQMAARLGHDKRLCEMLIPKWEFGCKRVTPALGYLECFRKPNVHLSNSGIVRVSENAIHTADGEMHEVDIIICATGFDVSFSPRCPIVGLDEKTDLAADWLDSPESYMSVAVPNYPNFFMLMGPRNLGGQGTLIQSLDWIGNYIVKWVRKMATEDIKYVHPKADKTRAFMLYGDSIHSSLVWSGGCSSWYKRGTKDGRVTVLFGGGIHLFHRLFSEIRGEDFDIVYRTRNPWRFLGNGFLEWEFREDADLSWYLEEADGDK
ncbi:hypothetical protein ACKVV1_000049 [Pyricularia oryzae]